MIIAIANSIGSGTSIATRGSELITNGYLNQLGSELFENSGFGSNLTGWTILDYWNYSSSYGGSAKNFSFYLTSYDDSVIYQEILTSGKDYKIGWDFVSINTTRSTYYVASSATENYANILSAKSSNSFTATTDFIGVRVMWLDSTNYSYLKSLSVKEKNPDIATQWTTVTGWSIDNINGKFVAANTVNQMYQTGLDLEVADYEVKYTLEVTSGTFRAKFGNSTYNNGTIRSTSGDYTETISCTNASNNIFILDGVTAFTGSVSNISVKKILE